MYTLATLRKARTIPRSIMIVSIDLGTNSLISVYKDEGVEVIPNALNETLSLSEVSLDDDGHEIVGRVAEERLLNHPDKTAANYKL